MAEAILMFFLQAQAQHDLILKERLQICQRSEKPKEQKGARIRHFSPNSK